MQWPTLAVVMTINDRPVDVIDAVLDSLLPQGPQVGGWDQLVIVFDRTPQALAYHVERALFKLHNHRTAMEHVILQGNPGWLCPAKAWNAGLARVKTELTYCISSEVIQGPENIHTAKALLRCTQGVVFGRAVESDPDGADFSVPGGVLCSADNPRPLGFIMAMPTWMVRATGGYDEGFMAGYWYDDDDFTFRLWQLGLPFIFADKIHGIHQTHPRPVLATDAGRDGITRNAQYITSKYGVLRPLNRELASGRVTMVARDGLTVWFPHTGPGLLDARIKAWELPVTDEGKIVVVH